MVILMPLLFPIYAVDFFTNLWYNHSMSERQMIIYIIQNLEERQHMENAPGMVFALYAFIFIFILAIAFLILAIALMIKGKREEKNKCKLGGHICLILSIICFVPIFLVVGYCLYLVS